jgi:hypothetical protein
MSSIKVREYIYSSPCWSKRCTDPKIDFLATQPNASSISRDVTSIISHLLTHSLMPIDEFEGSRPVNNPGGRGPVNDLGGASDGFLASYRLGTELVSTLSSLADLEGDAGFGEKVGGPRNPEEEEKGAEGGE